MQWANQLLNIIHLSEAKLTSYSLQRVEFRRSKTIARLFSTFYLNRITVTNRNELEWLESVGNNRPLLKISWISRLKIDHDHRPRDAGQLGCANEKRGFTSGQIFLITLTKLSRTASY